MCSRRATHLRVFAPRRAGALPCGYRSSSALAHPLASSRRCYHASSRASFRAIHEPRPTRYSDSRVSDLGVAIIGTGAIALANHLPGLALTQARVVALCDTDQRVLDAASSRTGIATTFTDYHDTIAQRGVDA